jgi:hypothetical protein
VRESAEQVLERIVEFRRRLLSGTGAWHLAAAGILPIDDASAGKNEK